MKTITLAAITKSPLRRSLYHFTRARNLPGIAGLDRLAASVLLDPEHACGMHRTTLQQSRYQGRSVWLNAHLRITPEAMAPDTTPEQFRACLDRHVFLWPTERDCLAMAAMYSRREPGEHFAILKFSAYELLSDHFEHIRLSKYDSGSSPVIRTGCLTARAAGCCCPLNVSWKLPDIRSQPNLPRSKKCWLNSN